MVNPATFSRCKFEGSSFPELAQAYSRERVREKKEPRSLLSKAIETLYVLIDSVSVSRNGANAGSRSYSWMKNGESLSKAAPGFSAKMNTAVGYGVGIGGVLGCIAGPKMVYDAASGFAKAHHNDDIEGMKDSSEAVAKGVSYTILSASMVGLEVSTVAAMPLLATVATLIFNIAGFAFYTFVGGSAIRKGLKLHDFENKLNAEKTIEKTFNALRKEVEMQKNDTLATLERKWDRFAAMTSEDCCRVLRDATGNESNKTQEVIVKEVRRALQKQKTKQIILGVIAVLGLAAMISGFFFFAPFVVPVLFAIGGVLWLTIDSSWVQTKLLDRIHGKPSPEFHEIIESLKLDPHWACRKKPLASQDLDIGNEQDLPELPELNSAG